MRILLILVTALELSGCATSPTRQQLAHESWCAKFNNNFPDIQTSNACPPPVAYVEGGGLDDVDRAYLLSPRPVGPTFYYH
jgi:hypothetical protein